MHRLTRARRGNYSILFALTLVLVMGFGALSVDVSLMTMARLQAQAAADSASHAGLVTYLQAGDVATGESTGTSAVQWVVDHANVGMGTPSLKAAPEFGTWNFAAPTPAFGAVDAGDTPNAVRVTVQRVGGNSVPLMLAPFLGVADFEVEATSVAAQEMRALMVVQDMSCSMMGSAVDHSRAAVEYFVDYIGRKRPQAGDQFGLSMFANTATFPSGCTACATMLSTSPPWIPLGPVKGHLDTIEAGVDGICRTTVSGTPCGSVLGVPSPYPSSDDIGSCTNPTPALNQAIHQLVTNASVNAFRGIVFFSDGLPNALGTPSDCMDDAASAADAFASADLAWANDINIWTILLYDGSFSSEFMEDMTRGIGFYQGSGDPAEIKEMFEQVAKALPTALVD